MDGWPAIRRWGWLCCLAAAGCAENPYMLQRQVASLTAQQTQLAQTNKELTLRNETLDKDNQEMSTLLAQSRQQGQLQQEQLAALRDQLGGATEQIAKLRDLQQNSEKRAEALVASTKKRAGATIAPNNSLLEKLPEIHLPGVQVRRDGDVIRLELPAESLFEADSAKLKPGAAQLLEGAAAELRAHYAEHFIGIEGHTDTDPVRAGNWPNNHQLSVGRAAAVYEQLVANSGLQAKQLFIAGHGGNHPVVSNATAAGKQRNKRIELVIYPDSLAGR